MNALTDFIASGWIAPVAILVLWVETLVLSRMSNDPGRRLRALAANAMSGTCLLGAVWAALVDAHPGLVALCLAASLAAHVMDVLVRSKSG